MRHAAIRGTVPPRMAQEGEPSEMSRRPSRLAAALLLSIVPSGAALAEAPAAGPAPVRAVACDAPAAIPAWPRIHVLATGARRVAGNVTFTLYGDDPKTFLKHAGSLLVTRVTLTGPTAEGCVAVSAAGTYALAIYHDENDNHHFDRTLLGLPAEGYGFSNDAPTLFGPPAFAATRFAVPAAGTRLAIRLRY